MRQDRGHILTTFSQLDVEEVYTPLLYRRAKKGATVPLVAEVPMVKISETKAIAQGNYEYYCTNGEEKCAKWGIKIYTSPAHAWVILPVRRHD